MSIQLPNIALTNNAFTLDLRGISFDSLSWIEFLNESPQTLNVIMGGMQFPIPAWYDYPVEVQKNVNGVWVAIGGSQAPVNISPTLLPVLSSNMSNVLIVTLYQKGQVPAITTPQPLFRQGWIPNTVNSTGGTANRFQADGDPNPTQVMEVTPLGAINSTFTLRNDAIMALGNRTGQGGILNIFGDILSALSVDGSINVGNPATIQLIGATGSITAQQLTLQAGNTMISISWFGPYTSATTPTMYNHNMSPKTPQIILTQPDGGVTTSRTINVSFGSMTSTQFQATCNLAGFSFRGIALAFA